MWTPGLRQIRLDSGLTHRQTLADISGLISIKRWLIAVCIRLFHAEVAVREALGVVDALYRQRTHALPRDPVPLKGSCLPVVS
jgi:hypothetical protein